MRRLSWILIATALVTGSAEADGYRPPKTASGAPDLQGIWTNTALTFLQRPPIFKGLIATDKEAAAMLAGFKQFAGSITSDAPIDPTGPAPPVVKEAPQADFLEMDLNLARIDGQMRSSWIIDPVDGRIPFTDAGRKAARAGAKDNGYAGPETRPTDERCLTAIGSPEGPPMMNTGFNGHYQITQTPSHVAILVEMNHDVRIIRLMDHAPTPAAMQPWMGDSIGWYEGDTLVVQTTHFNTPGAFVGSLGGGFMFSPEGKLTERFTRKAKDLILYEFSVEDPAHFTKVWRAEMPMRAARGPIYEYACHEGNYSLPNILRGARVEEAVTKANSPGAAVSQ